MGGAQRDKQTPPEQGALGAPFPLFVAEKTEKRGIHVFEGAL